MEGRCHSPLQDERFLVLETLGRGGMGAVYRAFDRAEQRLVALKVLSGKDRHGPGHPLSAEFEAWSRLDHPNIVRVYELCLARSGPLEFGTPYLVMELIEGGPVHRVLRPGRLEADVANDVARQLLGALAHVHETGYVHRDLKPGNVLVRARSGRARRIQLTDFGLAAEIGSASTFGTFSGSLPYVSPEALLGLPLDGRADLYGLGILLYHLSTGELPVTESDPDSILRWHLSGPPADPRRVRPHRPQPLAGLIGHLTRRERSERPASAAHALRSLGSDGRTAAARDTIRCGRAERANMRLALDAVRLGASRVFLLPPLPAASVLAREASIWAQVRGIRFFRLPEGRQRAPAELARLVLRLVLEQGPGAAGCVRRHGLDRALPLELLGNLPILDPCGMSGTSAANRAASRSTALGIVELLLHCARARPLVLCLESPARADPLVRALGRRLARAVESARSFGRGGVLLLTGPETESRQAV